jgi:integrase
MVGDPLIFNQLLQDNEAGMRRQLTKAMIEKLAPPASGRLEIFDAIVPALAVRVTNAGAKSFVVRGRIKGWRDPIRVTLGDALTLDLKDARQEASEVLRACRAGNDPREARAAANHERERQSKNTFAAVAEDFIAQHVSKLRSKDHTEAEIRRYLIAPWGRRPISSITAEVIGECIRAIVDEGKPHMARLVLAHIKRLFRWAAAPGRTRVQHDPCAALSAKKDFDIAVAPRQVALSRDHLRLIWTGADTLGDPFGSFFRMLLLSGQRRSEVAEMKWNELDLEREKVWLIPASRMKAKRPHEVPLSLAMLSLLLELRGRRGEGDYVFSTSFGQRPVSGFSKAKGRLDKIMAAQIGEGSLAPWAIHDIRRAVRTGLGAIPSVPHDIRELVIAHVPPALVQTYDLHAYRDEKRAALTLWSKRLDGIVEPAAAAKW